VIQNTASRCDKFVRYIPFARENPGPVCHQDFTAARKASEVRMGHSIWQSMEQKGYSRRDFLQFSAAAATVAGLGKTGAAQVAKVFDQKEKPAVVWLHFQECTCCSESFIRASHPIVVDALLDVLSLNYSETLMAASGFQAEKCLTDTIEKNKGKYIVLVEGAVPLEADGVYCMIGGKTAESILQTVAKDAAAVVAWGSCASNGCVQAAKPNPTGATPIYKLVDKPVINVPGCPPIADVMMGVVTHLLVLGQIPALDSQGRPKEFYGRRVHDTCYRRPNYDAGLFVESFDDENARKGYCLYKMGCRGPVTYNACSVTKWNEDTSYPIQSGHAASVAARQASGTTVPSTSTCRPSQDSALKARQTPSAQPWGSPHSSASPRTPS
jgi:hydrogenase small subunit